MTTLFSFEWISSERPSVESVCDTLGISSEMTNKDFGVIPLETNSKSFSIMLEDEAVKILKANGAFNKFKFSGPFSNPTIEAI